jgi:hypothetical protein
MLLPLDEAVKVFGFMGASVLMVVELVFFILLFVFFALSIVYVRYLVKAKCECSEDVRREVMYIYSIYEIVILSLSVVFGLIVSIALGAFGLAIQSLKNVQNKGALITENVKNPIAALSRVPGDVKKVASSLKNATKKIAKSVKSLKK